ncbi:hypothetical protein MPG36_06655 [Helicobacter pylori]|uniref:hypothetical protein n=1 Tax=Helicobacter pylori TaxID=210 RepID=UPI001FD04CB1|nr:hypothetical protein [Helicobacter pylori]UOR80400.1 hypothetical protein MPG36_06655 [Helicobacter pylori]
MQTIKNKAFRVSIQWNVLVRKLLSLERGTLTYSKNNSFKVVGGYFAMNTPFNPQLTPLKTLFKEPFALAFFRVLYKKPFRWFHILGAQNVKLKFLLAHIF